MEISALKRTASPTEPRLEAEISLGGKPARDSSQTRRLTASDSSWIFKLGPRNIGAAYVIVLSSIVFSVLSPAVFPRFDTVTQVVNANAVTAMAALAIIVPLSAGVFDLSFAFVMSLSGCVASYFVVNNHMPILYACLLGMFAALLAGGLNSIVVVGMKVDAFIGTMAVGSLVQAFISFFTDGTTIDGVKLAGSYSNLGQSSIGGIRWAVIFTLIIAVALWVLLEHTATGRRLYAVGFNLEAAKLAHVRTARLRIGSLLVCSLLAGFAGLVLSSSISSGSPTAGTPYLLPAYATAFVGATQLKGGRFNAWGTAIAVLMLGTGQTGLALIGAPLWAADMFVGVVLVAALAVTGLQRRGGDA